MKNKFKKEKYISQVYSENTDIWSFQVKIRKDNFKISKTFSEKDYGSAKAAFNQAIIFRDQQLYDFRNNITAANEMITLNECFEKSLDLFNYRMKTRKNQRSIYDRFIKKDLLVKDLNNAFALECLNKMTSDCNDDMIARAYTIFKNIDRTALFYNYYSVSHINYIKVPRSHKILTLRNERITDKQTLTKVISILRMKINDPYEKDLFENVLWTMYYTGCRPGEVFALTKKDFDKEWIYINKEVGSTTEDFNMIRMTKTKESTRKVPIANELMPFLLKAKKSSKSDLLFPNLHGQYYNSNIFGSRIKRNLKGSGIQFSCYMLRHLFQTDLKYSGVDDKTIDVLVGHVNKRTLDVYIHTNDDRLKKAIFLRKECVHSSTFCPENVLDDQKDQ